MGHPEADPVINNLFEELGSMELVDVWCIGCGAFRKMNANFAKHLNGEINSCAKCRNLKLK
jgi:NAD-dependent SIR2 family protein deacetylase